MKVRFQIFMTVDILWIDSQVIEPLDLDEVLHNYVNCRITRAKRETPDLI